MKPKILLSFKGDPENYVNAINLSGGEAVLYPSDIECDGLLLCGGGDIEPSFYNEENSHSIRIDIDRDKREFELLEKFIKEKKPILGICRGLQVINVFFGGTLFQDIPNHSSDDNMVTIHNVSVKKDSFLYSFYGENIIVNSYHHQAIKVLGENLFTIAQNENIIEGIVHETLPIMALQFHPERMCYKEQRPDTVDGSAIFKYFISSISNSSRFGGKDPK